jgi:SpoVK/Ycf46/Vps4 family AAA+-type ATPase
MKGLTRASIEKAINTPDKICALASTCSIILHGPTGTGKTTAVGELLRPVAGLSVFCQKASGILSSYKAGNTSNITLLFNALSVHLPAALVVDEADGLFEESSGSSHDDKIVAAFKENLNNTPGIAKFAMTNNFDQIEKAIVGRFGREQYVPALTHVQRRDMFTALCSKTKWKEPPPSDQEITDLAEWLGTNSISGNMTYREMNTHFSSVGANRKDTTDQGKWRYGNEDLAAHPMTPRDF